MVRSFWMKYTTRLLRKRTEVGDYFKDGSEIPLSVDVEAGNSSS